MTLLLGNELTTEPHKGTHIAKKQAAWVFKALATGTVEEIALRTDSELNTGITALYLGIFEKSGTKPGTLLGSGKFSGTYPPGKESWIVVSGLSISVTKETEYYFGICAVGNSIHLAFEAASGGTQLWESSTSVYEKLETIEAAKWSVEGKLGPNRMYAKGTEAGSSVALSATLVGSGKLSSPLILPVKLSTEVKSSGQLLGELRIRDDISANLLGKGSLLGALIVKSPPNLEDIIKGIGKLESSLKTALKLSDTLNGKGSLSGSLSIKSNVHLESKLLSSGSLSGKLTVANNLKGIFLSRGLLSAQLFVPHTQEELNLPERISKSKRIYPVPVVQWNWWLCKTSNLGQIAELNSAHSKNLQLMLNQAGTGTFWMHLEDPKSYAVEEHTTSIIAYRNGKAKWSGEIFKTVEECDNQNKATINVTAMGWFEILNRRLVHTGLEWEEMATTASGRTIIRYPPSPSMTQEIKEKQRTIEIEGIQTQYKEVVAEAFYTPLATESSQQLFYNNKPMALIMNDLIIRANIDSPTLITIGEIAPTNSINLTVNQFQNVGEQITKITALESGPDFNIDPLTRKFNTYRNEFFEGKEGLAGLGKNRGSGIRFTFPGNCLSVNKSTDGIKTQNRTEVTGPMGVAKAENVASREENGLFEAVDSLPEVYNTNILIAYATIETETLEKPFTIITFSPKAVAQSDIPTPAVPRPFEDYEIGDIVYAVIKKGRLQIGLKTPQAVRVFGFTTMIEDSGTEKISNLQTTYSNA